MKIIEDYEKALQDIYDHVGLVEDWVVCPIDDKMDMYWKIENDSVKYAESKKLLESEEGDYYVDEIYQQRFYKKWVYEGMLLTLVFCDPHVDGMKWWRLFDNAKKIGS